MARCAMEVLQLTQVVFIPCRISPHKTDTEPSAAADRLKMLELATAHLPWASISDWETRQVGPSYSWKTAEAMKALHPDARLFWIMGTDQWNALLRWDQPERLASMVEFIVICRGAFPEKLEGFTMHPVRFDHPASSTQIRKDIADGNFKEPWLDENVAEWIDQHRLYQQ